MLFHVNVFSLLKFHLDFTFNFRATMLQKQKVKSIAVNILLLFSIVFFIESCSKPDDTPPSPVPVPVLATVSTTAISSITSSSAISGGTISTDGGSSITSRGICYAPTTNPTTANTVVTSGAGTGTFTANLNSLTANTIYYVRAFAINSTGTAYGNQVSFTTGSIITPPPPTPVDTAVNMYIGGGTYLFAFNAQNGNLKWKVNLTTQVLSSPAYANGYVYVATKEKLYAYDTTGNFKWVFTMGGNIDHQSPIVNNGIVYINTSNSRDIYAINAVNGNQIWHANPVLAGNLSFGSSNITYANNTIFINSSFMYAFDALTGVQKWNRYTEGSQITPTILNNRLYSVETNTLTILDANTGNLLFSKDDLGLFRYTMAINVGYGTIFCANQSIGVTAVDSATGASKWFNPNSWIYSPLFYTAGSGPIIQDSVVYVHSNYGVWSYNPFTGAGIHHYIGDGGSVSCPTVVNGIIYFGTRATSFPYGHVFAKNAKTNSLIWSSTENADFLLSAPCIVTKSGKMHRYGKVYN